MPPRADNIRPTGRRGLILANVNDLWPRLSEEMEYRGATHPLRGSGRSRPLRNKCAKHRRAATCCPSGSPLGGGNQQALLAGSELSFKIACDFDQELP